MLLNLLKSHLLPFALFGFACTHTIALKAEERCLKIGYDANYAEAIKPTIALLGQAYKEIAVCAEWVELGLKRQESKILREEIDGIFLRPKSFIAAHQETLTYVDHIIADADPVILSLKETAPNCSPEHLKDHEVGFHMGLNWIDKALIDTGSNPVAIPNIDAMDTLLKRKRIDFLLHEGSLATLVKQRLEADGLEIRECPLPKEPLYHILHKKHAAIADRLNTALDHINEHPQH